MSDTMGAEVAGLFVALGGAGAGVPHGCTFASPARAFARRAADLD
jgi:F0F1-type ATP synthase membrane subunit c/vacuolar-type H+-ATPase subunit K